MNDLDQTTEVFNQHRGLLFAIAYRMLGTVSDAEDMLQEAYLRWRKTDPATVQSPKAFLSSVVTRLCVDELRSARTRREDYIGPWLPEPMLTAPSPQPSEHAELAESLSMAFLALLERLSPTERAAYLLHEIFDFGYAETAVALDANEATCRQWVKRAKDHLAQPKARFTTTPTERQAVTAQFVQACQTGDMAGLVAVLAQDIVSYADGGGKVRGAGLHPVAGAEAVARLMLGLMKRAPEGLKMQFAWVNGEPAIVGVLAQQVFNVLVLHIVGAQVQNIYSIVNPDKLQPIAKQLGL
jgi:RNA polymerase sigma-70 factor (ECF subfamily)